MHLSVAGCATHLPACPETGTSGRPHNRNSATGRTSILCSRCSSNKPCLLLCWEHACACIHFHAEDVDLVEVVLKVSYQEGVHAGHRGGHSGTHRGKPLAGTSCPIWNQRGVRRFTARATTKSADLMPKKNDGGRHRKAGRKFFFRFTAAIP